MRFRYNSKKISGILTVVPKNEKTFEEEMANYESDLKRTKRLKTVMGYEKHRLIDEGICVSDLAVFGMEYLFNKKLLSRQDISALVLVTQSPDYFMPATSNVIQGKLGLSEDVYCLDINQGCAGYVIGLLQAFSLLDQSDMKKVILINADVLSKKTSKFDRNSYPLIGDAAAITIVENDVSCANEIFSEVKMNGKKADVLMIPAGGFKMPSNMDTAKMIDDGEGNKRSLDNLVMKGGEVFNFVQTEVPPLIDNLLDFADYRKEAIDYFIFHQPNKFMLEKLADAMQVPKSKMPNNIVTYFGNASGVTIPTNICYNLGKRLLESKYNICLAGFGVGLTWGGLVLEIGDLDFCHIVEF